MRNSSLSRVVLASFGVFAVITLGCGGPPSGPSDQTVFSVRSILPAEGPTAMTVAARIAGTGFEPGDTVTVDGSPVAATILSATSISLAMPVHAAGKVEVTVSRARPIGTRRLSVPGGYRYSVILPPAIGALLPNMGSTAGGVPVFIQGDGTGSMWSVETVTIDGVGSPFESGWPEDGINLSMPARVAGTVEVIVTDRFGQAARGAFTYVPPDRLDFNGDWEGWARLHVEVPSDAGARLLLTIRDNTVVSVSCSVCRPGENCSIVSTPSLTPDPPPVMANGEFSSVGVDGVSIAGKILSPVYATGSINTASCGSRYWWADKK